MRIESSGRARRGRGVGLGEATARRLHEHGAVVTIADVNDEKGEALADELGEDASFVKADVTNEDEVEAAVSAAAGAEGGLRISVCCAGVGWAEKMAGKRGARTSSCPSRPSCASTSSGTFNVLRFAAAAMLANEPDGDGERGVCVNTASIAAYDGQIGQIAYSASKGGVVGMTLPAARDLASHGHPRVTIAPGLFDTPLLAALPRGAARRPGRADPLPLAPRPTRTSTRRWPRQIVENQMLNGEVIRLDGALRMAPR